MVEIKILKTLCTAKIDNFQINLVRSLTPLFGEFVIDLTAYQKNTDQ